jgi:hypothetical protein
MKAEEWIDPLCPSAVLVLYLNELPSSLLPPHLYEKFIEIAGNILKFNVKYFLLQKLHLSDDFSWGYWLVEVTASGNVNYFLSFHARLRHSSTLHCCSELEDEVLMNDFQILQTSRGCIFT